MEEELQAFRNKWREELTTGPSSEQEETLRLRTEEETDKTSDNQNKAEDSGASNLEDKKHEESTIQRRSLSDADRIRSLPNTLEPFLLAERLLEESNSATPSRTGAGHLGSPPHKRQSQRDPNKDNVFGVDNTKRRKENSAEGNKTTADNYLDVFLADLNEINEIPFFEISLPREIAMKIFKFLDASDLCHCAQVSKAWQSLAEDEVLWCAICHQMKYEEGSVPIDKHRWKEIVREHVMQNKQLQSNWKTRTGRSKQLQYVQGGVLRAAHSHGDKVVLGFTNGDVKFWRVHQDGEECVFKPSDTALALLHDDDFGTASNVVSKVVTNDTHVVAGYSQGNVDIWSQDGSTNPVHSFRGPQGVTDVAVTMDTSLIVANFRSHLAVVSHQEGQFTKVDSLDIQVISMDSVCHLPQTKQIHQRVDLASHIKLVPRRGEVASRCHLLVVAHNKDTVSTHIPGDDATSMSTVSQVYGHNVLTMDVRQDQVAFGFSNYLYNMEYGVQLFDVGSCRKVTSLTGYTAAPSCINLCDAPPHTLVTGCRSSVVRVYDVRVMGGFPVMTFQGHQRGVVTVQMDDWKVVSGGGDGLMCVWDQRMAAKLWELHGRYPVKYAHFDEDFLVTANIPDSYSVPVDPFDNITALRYRGSVHVYDFSTDQTTKGLPDICSSTYDEPAAYNYNVRLAVPYDNI